MFPSSTFAAEMKIKRSVLDRTSFSCHRDFLMSATTH